MEIVLNRFQELSKINRFDITLETRDWTLENQRQQVVFLFYLNLWCRPSDLQLIQPLQGLIVPLDGVRMSVTCPVAVVYKIQHWRTTVSLSTAINCWDVWPGVLAYFSQTVLGRRPPRLPHLHSLAWPVPSVPSCLKWPTITALL